jgi:hypothetical protein
MELHKVEALLKEIRLIGGLIAMEPDEGVKEELKQEKTALIIEANKVLGTDHILAESKISFINDNLYNV